ncbi:MAG: DUF3419 family protein [Pirellulaceae bacterium]
MEQRIEERADFDLVRYANCWEDADILCEALQPAAGKRFLSIASAGDNSLSLLAAGAEVVAVDLSSAQLACLELRKAAFAHLDYEELLAFLGVNPSECRMATWRNLRDSLSPSARAYWDNHQDSVEAGVIHCGKFESYFRKFRTRALPLVHSRRKVARLLEPKSREQRFEFYDRHWNTLRWRMMFRVFFSRFVMGRLGRDPEFFRYVEGSVAQRILERTKHAITELPTHDNPYLTYILTGNYAANALPNYLRPEQFSSIRDNLSRLTLAQMPVDQAAREFGNDGFDGFNLSDVFEYLNPDLCRDIFVQLLDVSRRSARLVYWNMLVPRHCPEELGHRVDSLQEFADQLFAEDRAWFYSGLVVEEVAANQSRAEAT